VVLLDEIEKAHPDVWNVLLQVLDDGRLTDNKGRVVNFKNTIIIMTSNIGSHLIQENFAELDEINRDEVIAKTKNQVFELLKQTIRPEFLNRIDDIILFQRLNPEQIRQIVSLQASQLKQLLSDRHISLEFDESALKQLGKLGFDVAYGARPLKRVLQQQVLDPLALMIIDGKLGEGDKVVVKLDSKNQIVYEVQQSK
jgi:ATP-dependent Clp protease ATP-binding subunit ClpB